MTFCAQCGAERPDSAAFCGKCGTPAGAKAPAAPAAPTAPATQNAGGFVPSKVITTFVMAFFLPVVALFLAISGKREARAAGPTADALNRIAFIVSIILSSIIVLYVFILIIAAIVAAASYNSYYY